MRIRSYLAWMVAAALVPVVIAAAVAVGKVRQAERTAALAGLNETVRATSLVVDRETQGSLSALKALGDSAHLQSGDMQAFYAQALALNQPPHVWTLLLDDKATLVLNTALPFGTPLPPASALQQVRQALDTQRPVVSNLMLGAASGRLVTAVMVPARASGANTRYVVAQAFAVEHWQRMALTPPGRDNWIVAVIDGNGKFIARSHKRELLGKSARPELVAAAAAQTDGMIRHHTLEGIDVYDAFTHSALTGWTIAVAAPVQTIESSATEAVRWLLIGIAASLCAAALLALFFGRGLVRSIHQASAAARALGGGTRPPTGQRSAVREITALHLALQDASTLLDHERASRQAAERERERLLASELATEKGAKLAALAQNQAKDQFLAMLGHELRSPLAAISSAAEVLQLHGGDAPKRARFLDIIRRQDRHLRHIVDDLTDVSRLLAGKIELQTQRLALDQCVAQCLEGLRLTAQAGGYTISVHAEPVWINGDAVRIAQIVLNLVSNALKYCPPGSAITVDVVAQGSIAILRVSDNGPGLSHALLQRIFEPFFQGPALPERVQSGMGIGLALVRQLVELHGGTVQAQSDGPGLGSVFTVALPRSEAGEPEPAIDSLPAALGRRLLLVEDNPDARCAMAELLRALGHEVSEAADGAQALAACATQAPDLIIMDIGLPDQSGYALAARFRSAPATRHTPLVALTGYGQEGDKDRALASGFSAHLVKPVDMPTLLAVIDALLLRVL